MTDQQKAELATYLRGVSDCLEIVRKYEQHLASKAKESTTPLEIAVLKNQEELAGDIAEKIEMLHKAASAILTALGE